MMQENRKYDWKIQGKRMACPDCGGFHWVPVCHCAGIKTEMVFCTGHGCGDTHGPAGYGVWTLPASDKDPLCSPGNVWIWRVSGLPFCLWSIPSSYRQEKVCLGEELEQRKVLSERVQVASTRLSTNNGILENVVKKSEEAIPLI